MAGKSQFSPFRVLDTSLTASGSVYMNERPKLGSEQGGLNVHLWIISDLSSVAQSTWLAAFSLHLANVLIG
jgi:hypothetical protein